MAKHQSIELEGPKQLQEKTELTFEAYQYISNMMEQRVSTEDGHKRAEMDFVVSLIINLMVNEPFCLNCFMTRLMEVINKLESSGVLFSHTSEEEKQKMN